MPDPKNSNVNAALVAKNIEKQLTQFDRQPFLETLSDALAAKPTHNDWAGLSKQDPEKWSRAVFNLAKIGGYTEQHDHRHLHVHKQDKEFFAELTKSFGHDAAQKAARELGYSREEIEKLVPIESVVDEG